MEMPKILWEIAPVFDAALSRSKQVCDLRVVIMLPH
jgi:hypothetical protein